MKKNSSLFVRIFLMAFTCMAVPMLISLFYTSMSASNMMEQKVKSSLSSIALEKANQISLAFNDISRTTQDVATQPYVIDYFKELKKNNKADEVKTKYLSDYIKNVFDYANGLYENMFFGYEGKTIIDGLAGKSVGHVYSDSGEPWYKTVMSTPGAYIGNAQPSPVSGKPNTLLAYPVVDPDTKQTLAVFGCAVDLDAASKTLVKSNDADKSKTMLINSSGQVLGSETSSQILKLDFSKGSSDMQEFYKQVKEKNNGFGYFTLNGVKNIASYEKVSMFDMYVIDFMPVSQFTSEVNHLEVGIVVLMLGSILLFSILIFMFSRNIVKPIKLATDYMKVMADGDFSQSISEKSMKDRTETGRLMRSINLMQNSMKEMISAIVAESQKAEKSAESTSNVMELLNGEIEKVTSTTEDMSSSMEETAATTEEIAATSNELEKFADSIKEKAESGADSSKLISSRAQKLRESALNSQKSAEQIGREININMRDAIDKSKSVDKINELSEAILQIAAQTDLLAINAAIEAASAGEAGKGFAVVADEVRKLAEDSKNAISEIKNVTRVVVEAVNNLKYNSERIMNFINTNVVNDYEFMVKTGDKYYEDAEFIEKLVGGFSDSAQKLSDSMNSMTHAVNQISILNTESAGGAQSIADKVNIVLNKSNEVSEISLETKNISKKLQETVLKFKVQ